MPAEDVATSYYLRPAVMTAPGRYQPLLADLPHGIAALAQVTQGLLIHEHLTAAYGVKLTGERRASVHVRPVAGLLERIAAQDSRPLTAAREPAERLPGNCRHFTLLVVSMLRAQGTPARARCGFGGYFGTGMFEDHWVCEYWDESAQCWLLADVQIDEVQAKMFDVGFNLVNVPRDEFMVAADAWRQCQAGEADPASFGFSNVQQAGYWWIAGNLIRDVAALVNMEMLPWDCWGAMPGPAEVIDDELVAFFDRVAELTRDPDATFAELTGTYAGDDRLRVPGTVYNAVLSRLEPVLDGAPAVSAMSDFRQH
jgi:Transglutaminase-like superfamily